MKRYTIANHVRTAAVLLILVPLCHVLFTCHAAALEPPDREEIERLKATREIGTRLDFVKSLGNHEIDSYLLQRAINNARRSLFRSEGRSPDDIMMAAPDMAPPPAWQGMPSKGTVKILAVLIEFQDHTSTNTRNFIHSNLFGAGDAARAPFESLVTYYSRSSYNQLDLGSGNTLGWYRTSYNRSSVSQTTAGRENLIKEALNNFNTQGHDFSQYDNNGDGVVDYFVVIWSGPDNGWGNFWWGYQTSFSDTTYKLDNVRLGKYSWQWEARPLGGTFTPLVVIHETGHALGLPDYYDYDSSIGPDGGVGGLDIMDANRGDHNCFSKWVLEWVTPTYIFSGSQTMTLNDSGTSQDCVVVWPSGPANMFSEFFVVQNRHRSGNDNDTRMPGDGMIVWHVDATLNAAGTNYLYNNSFTTRKLLRLMEADGLEEVETGNGMADAGDYYKDGGEFAPCSKPSSEKYDGSHTAIKVSDFSAPGTAMTAKFEHGASTSCGSGWAAAYNKLMAGYSDLALFRKYRDTVVSRTDSGRVYVDELYRNSDEALQVLLDNPHLMAAARELIEANRNAVQEAVSGGDAALKNSGDLIRFLDAFSAESPEPLRELLQQVRTDIIDAKGRGGTFLGLRLSGAQEAALSKPQKNH